MTLQETLETIASSSAEDWRKAESKLGKAYYSIAVYKKDPRITLGFKVFQEESSYFDPWVNKFPDKNAFISKLDLLFENAVLIEVKYINVDGGRGMLPIPHKRGDVYSVPRSYYSLIKIVHELEPDAPDYDSYVKQAGFIISDKQWP